MSKRLDHIIRTILSEQLRPRYTTKTELLNANGKKFIATDVATRIGVSPTKVTTDMDKIFGFYIVVKRVGQIPSQEKDPLTQDTGLRDHVLSYLDSGLGGVWAQNRSTGWYWFLTADLLPAEKDEKQKGEKIFSKYRVLCAYVNADLIAPKMRANIVAGGATKGWIHTFKQGGLVFDLASINSDQWIYVPKVKIGGVEVEAGVNSPPYGLLNFKDRSPDARRIYNYFGIGIQFNIPTSDMNYYGCAHREIVKAFQERSGIPVTGNYDTATRDEIFAITNAYTKKLKDLGKADVDISIQPYDWSWLSDGQKQKIQDAIKTCQIENKEVALSADEIKVPEGGFKAGQVDGDTNFYGVQKLMLDVLEKQGASGTPQYRKLKTALENTNNQGDYFKSSTSTLGATQQIVKMIKIALQYTDQDPDVVDQKFIDFLKTKK